MMKDKLGGGIMNGFVRLYQKKSSYLIYDVNEEEKAKWTKKCVVKKKSSFHK